ncbi:MAG: SMP-30/gluconolactonase/LRE family protein [Bacteroidota bacterium]|nr:SMP-30/gluconolactonase/LRE family protein [Bacteroidota bacterium]
MKKVVLVNLFFLLVISFGMTQNNAKESPVIAKGAKLIRLSDQFSFTEGPAVNKKGDVYFTDQPNDRIMKWSAKDGSLTVFMEGTGRSNGMYFDHRGNLIACADLDNQLWQIGMDKKVKVLVKEYNGKLLNGPNDVWIDKKGGIYLTDPLYVRAYWKRSPKMQQDGKCVYYLSPDRKNFTRVADDLVTPNGIIGTPDNKYLYVADIDAKKIYRYDISPDGQLSNRKLMVEKSSDGMTIDDHGNFYICNQAGVTVFNSKGEQIEQIPIDEKWTANVCFGGKKLGKLFITASKSVFIIDMKVRGVR